MQLALSLVCLTIDAAVSVAYPGPIDRWIFYAVLAAAGAVPSCDVVAVSWSLAGQQRGRERPDCFEPVAARSTGSCPMSS